MNKAAHDGILGLAVRWAGLALILLFIVAAPAQVGVPPPNDNFAQATVLGYNFPGFTFEGTTVGATKEPGEPDHAGNPGGASIWWSWRPTVSGYVMLVANEPRSLARPLMAIYTGNSVSNLTLVADNRDPYAGIFGSFYFLTKANTKYYIAVDGYNGATGTVILTLAQELFFTPSFRIVGPSTSYGQLGSSASFSVVPPGVVNPSYQWMFNSNAIPGQTDASLTLTNLLYSDAGYYSVEVMSATMSGVSQPVYLSVRDGVPFTTFEGEAHASGAEDGPVRHARFNRPQGLTMDSAGNIYVADLANHAIRKIMPDLTTVTLAGGSPGNQDGQGGKAGFRYPSGVIVDGAGNVYVADQFNHAVRKIDPAGNVSTLAGLPGIAMVGTNDGAGILARFNHPAALALDGATNIYVADSFNSTIRKITPDGTVSTLPGKFKFPTGVAVDTADNVIVACSGDNTIQEITTTGSQVLLAGRAGIMGNTDGPATNALFATPTGVAVDALGNIIVADSENNAIRRIGIDGNVTTVAGQTAQAGAQDGPSSVALFTLPSGVALATNGMILVADTGNNAIRNISLGGYTTTLTGANGGTDVSSSFSFANGMAVDPAGNLYVTDAGNSVIQKIMPDGTATIFVGQPGMTGSVDGQGTNALLNGPSGIVADASGNLYIADTDNQTIRRVDTAGNVVTIAGQPGISGDTNGVGAAATFTNPSGLALDSAGNLFVAEFDTHLIRKIYPDGHATVLYGSTNQTLWETNAFYPATNGVPTLPGLSAIAADAAGNLYAAANGVVKRIGPDGVVTDIAGNAAIPGGTDGVGTNAHFGNIYSLAVDGVGNIYVADTENNAIRQVAPDGTVTTVAGFLGEAGFGDGSGPDALFANPFAIVVDWSGRIIVADTENTSIRLSQGGNAASPSVRITAMPSRFVLSWPGLAQGFVLESSPSLAPGSWSAATVVPNALGTSLVLTNTVGGTNAFFRLARP